MIIRSLRLYCEAGVTHAGTDPESLRRLAWLCATSPYAEVRDGRKAVRFAELACQVTGGRNTGLLSILAAAYAEAGDFEKAVATQQKAISLLNPNGDAQTIYASILKLYQTRQPFRDGAW